MNNLFNSFTRKYQLSKTLRFELIPQGKTKEHIEKNGMLTKDEQRAESYKAVKKIIDEYHKDFIDKALSTAQLSELERYEELYREPNKDEAGIKKFEELKTSLRKQVAETFSKNPDNTISDRYKNLFAKELINVDLKNWVSKENRLLVEEFDNFTTYFTGFHENRKNMYDAEDKSTAIAHRLIHQNLSKFLDNIAIYKKVKEANIDLSAIDTEMEEVLQGTKLDDIFSLNYFNHLLTQTGIDLFNYVLGGKSEKEQKKIKGVNEYINLYNQQQTEKKNRIPRLKPLYKQILSDRQSLSFILEKYESDTELLESIETFYQTGILNKESGEQNINIIIETKELLEHLTDFNLDGVHVNSGTTLTNISQKIFGSWGYIHDALRYSYDVVVKNASEKEKSTKKYQGEKEKWMKQGQFPVGLVETALAEYKKQKTNLETLEKYSEHPVCDFFRKAEHDEETRRNIYDNISASYEVLKDLLNTGYPKDKRLAQEKDKTILIKNFLDSIIELLHFMKSLRPREDISQKDETFYSHLEELYDALNVVTPLYNKVRNHLTQKPYSTEKVKLNFDDVELLKHWPKNAHGMIFQRKVTDAMYYLGIPSDTSVLKKLHKKSKENSDVIALMEYQQGKAGQLIQNLMIIDEQVKKVNGRKVEIKNDKNGEEIEIEGKKIMGRTVGNMFEIEFNGKLMDLKIEDNKVNFILEGAKEKYLPLEINKIRKRGAYNAGDNFNRDDLNKFIDYYKPLVCKYKNQQFVFRDAVDYKNFKDFTDHIDSQAYQINFNQKTSFEHINQLVDEGKLYLFQIYNKDFSPHSKGNPNLHTLYWKAIFDEKNLDDVVYKLNGQAEVFYRKKSIQNDKVIIHKANQSIEKKNPENENRHSTFKYDIVKDRRYTVDKFHFHVPITMNFKAEGVNDINTEVNQYLKDNSKVHIIGLDRGERHLLYLSLINPKGEIVQQYSLNEIVNKYNGNTYRTDYHQLLETKEGQRAQARKDWGTIETIKELKEGYLSQVVHKIAELIVEYNATVVMEDLNFGFKQGRQKVEKQIYQKFEKMLIDKLNYLVFKNPKENQPGIYNALQLANKFESFQKMGKQNGFIFYVPAWNTSKIDPNTGFVDFLKPRYESVEKAQAFISKFDEIRYNSQIKWFEFRFDYKNFTDKAEGSKTKWTVCTTNEDRYAWNKNLNNGKGGQEKVLVTPELKVLFGEHNIVYGSGENLIEQIAKQDSPDLFQRLLKLLNTTLSLRHNNGLDGEKEQDYILSPVEPFFDSRRAGNNEPENADANGAYHIAKKGLWLLQQIREAEDLKKVKLAISNKEWLAFVQEKTSY